MMRFTFEEESIIRCYPGENRKGVIDKLNEAAPYVKPTMRTLIMQTRDKVSKMTNQEFEKLFEVK